MKTIPFLMFCLLGTAAVTAEQRISLDEILDRHAAAIGVPLESVRVDLRIEEPEFTVTARYVARRDGRMRIDVYDGEKREFTEALDGNGGCSVPASSAWSSTRNYRTRCSLRACRKRPGNAVTIVGYDHVMPSTPASRASPAKS